MYIGGRHTATLTETVDIPFRCKACGVAKTARVIGVGTGTAASPYFVGSNRARDRAVEEASRAAIDIAERSLGFVACPACGAVDRKAGAGLPPKQAVVIVFAGAVVGAFLFQGFAGWIAGIGAGIFFVLLASRLQRRRAMLTAGTVIFFDGEPPDKPVIGAKCKVCRKKIVMAADGARCETCGAALHTKSCFDEHARRAHSPETESPYR